MEAFTAPRRASLALPRSVRLLSALPDEALVGQVRRGNESAFEAIYDRHHGGILSFCRHMLGSREEGEDALQQTFISAYADMAKDDRDLKLKAWLYAIARNKCLSMLRARRSEPSDEIEIATAGLSEDVQRRADLKEVLQDLEKLPEEQREALVLSELGDLSHAEVARVIGCEASKVKSLVFQARSALMESRKARETSCDEIREQLSTLRGGALRRGHLRRHVKACPGCTEFQAEVRRQRAAMAFVLPVVPTLGLKESVVAAVGIGKGAAAAGGAAGTAALAGASAGGSAAVTAGTGATGGTAAAAAGGGAAAAKTGIVAGFAAKGGIAAKLAVVAVAGVTTAGGVAVTEHELSKRDSNKTEQRQAAAQEKADAPAGANVAPPVAPAPGTGGTDQSGTERETKQGKKAKTKKRQARRRRARRRAALRRAGILPPLTEAQKERRAQRRAARRESAALPVIERVRKQAKAKARAKAKATPKVKQRKKAKVKKKQTQQKKKPQTQKKKQQAQQKQQAEQQKQQAQQRRQQAQQRRQAQRKKRQQAPAPTTP